jgi:LysR family transcriptional regulator, benzoate and cis,cis-muconate-responsive activator of ben and cat genes
MELRQLRYFVAVAQELSFTRAAQKLHLAQPALSRQIRQLEEEIGVRLLERNRRSTHLTDAGRVFLGEACALLEQTERAVRAAQKTDRAAAGQLNIGYVWGLFHSLAPAIIGRFRQLLPDIAVNLFDLTATEQADALVEGKLDAGFIGFAQEADTAGLAKRKVGTSLFVAALPEKHPVARKSPVPLRALADDLFIMISEQSYPGASHYVSEACERAGFRPKIARTVERGYTILGLVAARCGVALLPESLRNLPHPGVIFRPLLDPPQGDLFIAWRASRSHPARDTFLTVADYRP